jgi:hypothetical protein
MFGASGDLAIQRKIEKPVMTVEQVSDTQEESKNEIVNPSSSVENPQ